MLPSLMAAWLLAGQVSASPECVTGAAGRVCGYDCRVVGRSAACARTPEGRCRVLGGRVECVDPPPAPTPPPEPAPPEATCLTHAGVTACGYSCRALGGRVACAQTPLGVCDLWQGEIRCWDPPPVLAALPVSTWQSAGCEHNFTHHACGYHCRASNEVVRCAQTWLGICEDDRGTVTCWDPAPALIWQARGELPRPGCLASGDHVACGYRCESHYNAPACTQTPQGRCENADGRTTCWDPPIASWPPL